MTSPPHYMRSAVFGLIAVAGIIGHANAQSQAVDDVATEAAPFEADTLQSVLASVYRSNPRLLAERARLRETDENYIQARAQGRLTLSASGQFSGQVVRTPVASSFFGTSGGTTDGLPRSGQVSVVQPLYQGGRVKALKNQAKASILAARAGLENTENNIFLSAANAYVDVLRDEEAANIRRNNVRVLTRQLTAANDRFDVGEGTRTDIAQSESRLALAEAGLAQADAQLEVSRAQFVRLVGRMPIQPQPVPAFALPDTLDRAIALARENNPQLLASYYAEQAGDAAINIAKAAGRPTLSLTGSLAAQRETILGVSETDQATIAAQINIPIFSGGANASRVRQAKQARTRLAFETRDTERAVDQTVTQIWAQLQATKRVIETSRRQVDAADVAFEGVTLEQQVGTRTQLDVLDAEQEVLNARLTLLNAERDYNSAVFQLLSVIGVFDADGIALPVETYDESAYLENVAYDGLSKAVDRFVPEAVQKIGPQLPDLALDPARVVISAGDKLELDERAMGLVDQVGDLGQLAKESVDAVSGQTPEYDPRMDLPEVDIILPVNPDAPEIDLDEAVQTDFEDKPKTD